MTARRGTDRRARRRGISPIIAMILLVAIVVVLAAVLYVVVAGFGHTGATVPIGTALAAGPAVQTEGTKATNNYCQTSHYCYEVPITEAGSGLTLGDLNFKVVSATGAVHLVSGGTARLAIVDTTSAVLAYTQVKSNQPYVVTSWTKLESGTTSSTPITSLLSIWVQFGNTKTSPFGQGEVLEILGVHAYSGAVTVSLP
jgi:flagellin-like protein